MTSPSHSNKPKSAPSVPLKKWSILTFSVSILILTYIIIVQRQLPNIVGSSTTTLKPPVTPTSSFTSSNHLPTNGHTEEAAVGNNNYYSTPTTLSPYDVQKPNLVVTDEIIAEGVACLERVLRSMPPKRSGTGLRFPAGPPANCTIVGSTCGGVGNNVVPLLILPLLYDSHFFKPLVCSIDAPVHFFQLTRNSDDPDVIRVVTAVEKRLVKDITDVKDPLYGRVFITHQPDNRGFSWVMNNAIKFALTKSFSEVPWIYMANADTQFFPDVLGRLTMTAHAMTARDEKRIAELEAEVMTEPNQYTPEWRTLKKLRPREPAAGVGGGKIFNPETPEHIVSSYLLPDRIRYAPLSERHEAFTQHYAFFYPGVRSMSSFVFTRLAALTAGFWDENLYPAYFEDIDMRWRAWGIGFREHYTILPSHFHHRRTNKKSSKGEHYRTMAGRTGVYKHAKYGAFQQSLLDYRFPVMGLIYPFGVPAFQPDLYVLDREYVKWVRTGNVTIRGVERPRNRSYNISLLAGVGIPSELIFTPPPSS